MWDVTEQFLRTLRGPHAVVSAVDLYSGSTLLKADVKISVGTVKVDVGSQVRRDIDVTIADPDLASVAVTGNELHVRRGIEFPDGSQEWVPLGVFRVDVDDEDVSGSPLRVTGPDRAKAVADARFTSPESSHAGSFITTEIERLIADALPGVPVHKLSTSNALTPRAVWEEDRWAAIAELADAIGAEVIFNGDGDAVIRDAPTLDDDPAWTIDAGESGVLISGTATTTREGVYNAVVARGERTDSTPPVQVIVVDSNPASPTYWSGPFGHVPRFYTSPLITTTPQATQAGKALLARSTGTARALSLTAVPNPALDGGDVIAVVFPDGTVERHIVDTLSIPLGVTEAMPVTTRSSNPAEAV